MESSSHQSQFTINLTPAQYTAAVGRLAAMSPPVAISGPSGQLTAHNVTLDYDYNPSTCILLITIEHKPFLYPEGKVESVIRSWFQTA